MKKNTKPIFLLIIVVMLLQLALAPIVEAYDESYFTALQPKAYKMKNTFKLTNNGANEAINIKAVVLVGAVSNSPYQKNIGYKVTPWPKYTYVDPSGNIYAEVHIDKIKPKETKIIAVEKEVINSGVSYSDEIYRMDADYSEFEAGINNLQYFEAGEKVEVNAAEIKAKAAALDVNRTSAELAKRIYDFVNTYIVYDLNPLYANQGALSAIRSAKGVCDEYATLFTALSRALGIPARVTTGYWIDEENPLKAGVWNDVSSNAHAWAEFYIPLVGWIPVEPTFIYTYNGVRTPNSEYFANMKPGDVHLLQGYQQNEIKKDVTVDYSFYRTTKVDISFGEQAVMPVNNVSVTNAFTDIGSSWAKDFINELYNNGVVFAKQPGLFKPLDNITRAEFAAYLVNTLRLEPKAAAITFRDVKDTDDYASFIKTAAAYKLITGNEQGYFKPNDSITRQDAATIMKRAIDALNIEHGMLQEPTFADTSQVSPYAKDAVKLIYNMQIMTGKPGNLFEPKSFATRAEISKVLDNFLNVTE